MSAEVVLGDNIKPKAGLRGLGATPNFPALKQAATKLDVSFSPVNEVLQGLDVFRLNQIPKFDNYSHIGYLAPPFDPSLTVALVVFRPVVAV